MRTWVVVGAGSAGCVIARRLAGTPGNRVTLVEDGSAETPTGMRGSSYLDALDVPGRLFAGSFLRGRGLGGSSAVNGMLATSGDLEQYASWGWTDAADAFARVLVPRAPAGDDELGPLDRALLDAAPDAERVPLTRSEGQRVTSADAYLTPCPSDLTVVTDRTVESVALDGRRAVGVRLAGGTAIDADSVVLTAGAIGSPAILARSGVIVAGIGDGLRNHPAVPVTITLRPGVGGDSPGIVTATSLRRQGVQIVPLNHLGPGRDGVAMLLVAVMTPTGRGHVGVDEGAPSVELALSAEDRRQLDSGVELALDLLERPAFRRLVADVAVGDPPAGVFHATSTCAMGVVVDGDGDGAVVGHEGLYVADASVFPDIPSTNPYLPTLMLAERLASRLIARANAESGPR
jgi:choline dehydrogenase-like flavoprotein